MTDEPASTRGRALLYLIPIAVVAALGMLSLATATGHIRAWTTAFDHASHAPGTTNCQVPGGSAPGWHR